jgi:hypothetical protein
MAADVRVGDMETVATTKRTSDMEGLHDRMHELEIRARNMEAQLRKWKVLAFLIGLCAVGYACVLPGQAQPGGEPFHTFKAPFVVTGSSGLKLLEVNEVVERTGRGSQDALLTLYRNGQPAVMYRTTGKLYKDAYDSAESYLNVVETWLYRYPRDGKGKVDPTPYLASATALTRAGGSIAVFGEQDKTTPTPPFAARITARRGAGGAIMLFDAAGHEGKLIHAK